MKKQEIRIINRILILFIIVGITVPCLFTAVKMGVFYREPVIETPIRETDENAPVLRMATDYDFCPNSYVNKKGELSGLYIELMIEAANRMGRRPVFETADWMGCREMLLNGDVDVLLGLEIFSNMKGTLRTIPVCSDELRVYGKNAIDSPAALSGKKVALMARSVIASTYDLQCEYLEYNTNTEILKAVEDGEADYGICHGAVATKIIQREGFHLSPSLVIAKSYPALAVKETDSKLRGELNQVLQEMSLDGTIGRLQYKWNTEFTKDRCLECVLKENGLFYITFIAGMLVFICFIVAMRINIKRREQYIQVLLNYQDELRKSNEEKDLANQAKSEFLSHMSHDIRTPINGIMGMVEIIKKYSGDPGRMKECLGKIDMASHHLLSLINDVLDMSKIGSEGVKLEEVPIDVDEEMEKIHAIVDVQAEEKQIQFRIHTEGLKHRYFLGSPAHIRRILLNLLSNALRYNLPKGTIDLSLREIRCENDIAWIEFQVEDTGIGMSQEFMENSLYKPFTQENKGARTEYHGTGLGMSIVNELVKQMNGTIAVESRQGVGTTFTVQLPVRIDPEVVPKKGKKVSADADISGMRILAVEDNELNLEIVQFMLETAGAKVTAARDGWQAVKIFKDSKTGTYDLILMDILMPFMDGVEAAEVIRKIPKEEHPEAATIPIVAMTANAFAEDREKAFKAGMNDYLTKPIDAEALYHTLAKYRKNKRKGK